MSSFEEQIKIWEKEDEALIIKFDKMIEDLKTKIINLENNNKS